MSLYRGAFLEGFSLADCAPFEEWLLLKREQYTRLVLKTLYFLADYYETLGDFEQAQRCAWLQFEIEPWLEEGYQQLIRALAFGGLRSTALSQYETCRKLLARELGITPGRKTQNIYEAICKDDLAALHSSRNLAPQHPLEPVKPVVLPAEIHRNLGPDPPFVGFKSELAWLQGCLEESLAGAEKSSSSPATWAAGRRPRPPICSPRLGALSRPGRCLRGVQPGGGIQRHMPGLHRDPPDVDRWLPSSRSGYR